MGINDVWRQSLLTQANPPKNSNQQPMSQPQNNAIAQNKARIELIIHHLTVLRYHNVPKPNILQTMTTPKNWGLMLQILNFLAHDCQVNLKFEIFLRMKKNIFFLFKNKN